MWEDGYWVGEGAWKLQKASEVLPSTQLKTGIISIAKRCSYNSPAQRSIQPIQPIPLLAPERKKRHTERDQFAGVRLIRQNCDFMNNLFRKNFCRTIRKFRNCIKYIAKPQH